MGKGVKRQPELRISLVRNERTILLESYDGLGGSGINVLEGRRKATPLSRDSR